MKGFTLLELLVALIGSGSLVGILVPIYAAFVDRVNVRASDGGFVGPAEEF